MFLQWACLERASHRESVSRRFVRNIALVFGTELPKFLLSVKGGKQ